MTNESGVIGRSKAIKSYVSRLLLMRMKLDLSSLSHLAGLFLAAFGSIILTWVGWLIWYDMISWGKDIALIFFGSRTGEAIGLGIGMKVIHYFLISLALLLLGLLTVFQRRSKAIKLRLSCLLCAQPQKEKEEKKKKGETLVEPPEKEEKGPSECPNHFGHLASRPKNTPIPQECLICPKILECMHGRNF